MPRTVLSEAMNEMLERPVRAEINDLRASYRDCSETRSFIVTVSWTHLGAHFSADHTFNLEELVSLSITVNDHSFLRHVLYQVKRISHEVQDHGHFFQTLECELRGIIERLPSSRWFDVRMPWVVQYGSPLAIEQRQVNPQAEARARELLLSVLNEAQRADYLTTQSFKVLNNCYRIHRLRSSAVVDETNGDIYCVLCPELPLDDQMAALKLLLEADPETFFKTANVTRGVDLGSLGHSRLPGMAVNYDTPPFHGVRPHLLYLR